MDGPDSISIVICTHNRSQSLISTLESIYQSDDTIPLRVDILVVINNSDDDTADCLNSYKQANPTENFSLTWIEEPTPGKSNALNTAIRSTEHDYLCFIDDDQIVESGFITELINGIKTYRAKIFCGRIWPAWDGSEPRWVHATGRYAIPIRPFPEFDLGNNCVELSPDDRLPSGGNICVHRQVFETIGLFSTKLGPTGHNLMGGEDHEFLRRAVRNGFSVRYLPNLRQLHAIDSERTSFKYTLQKSYLRSKSGLISRSTELRPKGYMVRKIVEHGLAAAFTTNPDRRFFFLVRLAASLGELSGAISLALNRIRRSRLPWLQGDVCLALLLALALGGVGLFALMMGSRFGGTLVPAMEVALAMTILLSGKSLRDFSQTGPRMRDEVVWRYRAYGIFAMVRLSIATFIVSLILALPGSILATASAHALGRTSSPWWFNIALGFVGALVISSYMFVHWLVHNPGLVIASWQYRTAHLHRLSNWLSDGGVAWSGRGLIALTLLLVGFLATTLINRGYTETAAALALATASYLSALAFVAWYPRDDGRPGRPRARQPNLVLIGSDTLRSDRVGAFRNGAPLTPEIDKLARRGHQFTACYVPCARTAPSLISLFTGTWPHNHGIRDNFVSGEETILEAPALPSLLQSLGYRTAAVSDWCGADLGKFSFGFDILDLPDDQWNLKYLIRQGPKDIRLFLSMFLHNRVGRKILPEIYYLGGVPQTSALGNRGRHLISRLAATCEPFLLNIFYSTTHPPFASEYPYYLRHADPCYVGESKFAMARLTEPFEIIRRQGEPREEFDLDQILALYDGCVAQFDAEVGQLLAHLESEGLADNTIVVLYSDHGMEFFEHGTWGQGNSALGDFSARVPLIIADPRQNHAKRIDQVIRSIDLFPTLLELINAQPVKCDGCSVVPAMLDPGVNLKLRAFYETGIWIARVPGLPQGHLDYPELLELLDIPNEVSGSLSIKPEYWERVIIAKDRMVRDGRWKLVYQPLENGMRLALFDLDTDADCTHDLSVENPELVDRLWQELKSWIESDPVTRRHLGTMASVTAATPAFSADQS